MSPHAQKTLTKTPTKKRYNALWTKNTRNPGACALITTLLTAAVTFVLLVVNLIKLHLRRLGRAFLVAIVFVKR